MVNNFKDNLANSLKREEGVKFKPYRCTANKLTIGVGFNLEDGIPASVVNYWLQYNIDQTINEAVSVFGTDFMKWSMGRKIAICNMIYQLGLPTFMTFGKTIEYLKQHKWEEASKEMLDSEWFKNEHGGGTPERAKRMSELVVNG